MNHALVDKIVNATLYEGYILYPYRPAVKNRSRWTFGGVFPRSYCEEFNRAERSHVQIECLARPSPDSRLHVEIRFLHLTERRPAQVANSVHAKPTDQAASWDFVDTAEVDGLVHHGWQEAVERRERFDEISLSELRRRPFRATFCYPAQQTCELLLSAAGKPAAVIVRKQEQLAGLVEISIESLTDGIERLRIRVVNETAIELPEPSRDTAQRHSFASTHTLLKIEPGEFVSLTDPPEACHELVASCRNDGAWPVLVGDPGDRHTILAAPIILPDHPQVAPESAGDYFDGTEIDEMLMLRIRTLTDQERQAMAVVDARARALLDRSESLADESLARLHGRLRHVPEDPR